MDLRIDHLSHTFAGRQPRPAIENLTLRVPTGQFVALVGPSGCGKSTLLRLIAHLLTPTQGAISLGGLTPSEAVAQQRIAWMAQSPALLPWLTVFDNAALAGRLSPAGASAGSLPPDEALRRVRLSDVAGSFPFMLSGGMQQRLALARTLTLPAKLWLMDEPFAALDELTRERLAEELLELWRPLRPTVLWVTHNLHEAVRLADRVLVLTPRPARVAADIAVDLPHPRDDGDPAFIDVLRRVRGALTVEEV